MRMKIVSVHKVQGCLEGTNVRDIYFDELISMEFGDYLCRLGHFVFRKEIEKPFFKVMVRGRYTLKASVGNLAARLILPGPNDADVISEIEEYVGRFNQPNEAS